LACKTGRDCAMTICFSKLGIIYKIRVWILMQKGRLNGLW
jgi:hypothetical protein